MFEIGLGWMEMAMIALMALMVIGPKELPKVLRSMGHWMRKVRGLAHEFQSGLDDMVREADLEETRNAISKTKNMNINKIIEETVDPEGEVAEEARNIAESSRAVPAKPDADDPKTADRSEAQAGGGAGDQSEAKGSEAKVIHHPAQVAPAHSVTPPAEPEVETASSGDGEQKRA